MNEIEKKLWERTKKHLRILQVVPFLKMVAVCNNLAFSKVNEKSDIDLFIIAKRGRLFFVRTFVTFLIHLRGVRRHGKKVAGRFCLSFFVDESALDLSKIALEKDIYLAFWVKSMLPIIDIDRCSDSFLKKNNWALEYFENNEDFVIRKDRVIFYSKFKKFLKSILNLMFNGMIGNFLEKRLKNWQMRRAKTKSMNVQSESGIIVGDHILKFHNIDRRRQYRGLWEKQYRDEKITDEKFLNLKLYS